MGTTQNFSDPALPPWPRVTASILSTSSGYHVFATLAPFTSTIEIQFYNVRTMVQQPSQMAFLCKLWSMCLCVVLIMLNVFGSWINGFENTYCDLCSGAFLHVELSFSTTSIGFLRRLLLRPILLINSKAVYDIFLLIFLNLWDLNKYAKNLIKTCLNWFRTCTNTANLKSLSFISLLCLTLWSQFLKRLHAIGLWMAIISDKRGGQVVLKGRFPVGGFDNWDLGPWPAWVYWYQDCNLLLVMFVEYIWHFKSHFRRR